MGEGITISRGEIWRGAGETTGNDNNSNTDRPPSYIKWEAEESPGDGEEERVEDSNRPTKLQ